MLLQAGPSPTHQHTYPTDDSLSFTFKFFQKNLLHEEVFNLTKKMRFPALFSVLIPPPSNIPSDILIVMLPPLPTTLFGLLKSIEQQHEGLFSARTLIKMEGLLQNQLYISRREGLAITIWTFYYIHQIYGHSNYTR